MISALRFASQLQIQHCNQTGIQFEICLLPTLIDSVLFADRDYVGLFRRFLIIIIDGIVVAIVWPLLAWLWYNTIDPVGESYEPLMWSWIGFGYLYLAILKRSSVRTVGLWLTSSRIVDHKGNPPSLIRMTFRLLLWSLGPFNPIIDLLWLSSERHRQTLRDKFAGTYVVNRDATPMAHGKRKAAYYSFMGATVIFWEVIPVLQASDGNAETETSH